MPPRGPRRRFPHQAHSNASDTTQRPARYGQQHTGHRDPHTADTARILHAEWQKRLPKFHDDADDDNVLKRYLHSLCVWLGVLRIY